MNKIIKIHQIDIAVYRSPTAESIQKKKEIQKYGHITRSGIFRFLWREMKLLAAYIQGVSNEDVSAIKRTPVLQSVNSVRSPNGRACFFVYIY